MIQQLFKDFENPLIKFCCVLILTALYFIFLFNSYWGLGFSIINLAFLFLVLLNSKINQSKESLIFISLSFLFSLFIPLRSFWLSHYFTIIFVLFLDSLAVARAGTHDHPLNFKTVIGTPILTVLYVPGEIFLIIVSLIKLITTSRTSTSETGSFNQSYAVALKGIILAIPFLVLFFLLFLSADPLFSKYATNLASLIHFDLKLNFNLWGAVQLFLVFSFFSSLLSFRKRDYSELGLMNFSHEQQSEWAIAVLVISILFLAFLIVQVEYFFAGADHLKNLGVMLSDYTRRGYTELLLISGISLTLVSVLIKRSDNVTKSILIQSLSIVFLIEVFLLLLSATRRTYLYQDSFGFTEIRILGFILSIGMAGVLVTYLLKALDLLKSTSIFRIFLVNIFLMAGLLNILNIDYLVGAVKPPNLGYGVDYVYLAGLSSDGWQGWKSTIDYLTTTTDCNYFLQRSVGTLQAHANTLRQRQRGNWHNMGAFTFSDAQGYQLLQENNHLLEEIAGNFRVRASKQSSGCY